MPLRPIPRSPAALREAGAHFRQGPAQARYEREEYGRGEGDPRGKGPHAGIKAQALQKRHLSHHGPRDQSGKELHGPPRGSEAEKRFRQRPARTPSVTNWPSRRAREAPSELRTAISRLRLSERTSSRLVTLTRGDEQQQSRSAEQHQEDRADVADDDFGERCQSGALVAIGIGILLFEAAGDGFHLDSGGLDRDAVLQTADAIEVVAAAAFFAGTVDVAGWSSSPPARPVQSESHEAAPR